MYAENFLTNDFEPFRQIQFKFPMLFKPCPELESFVSCYWYAAFTGTEQERMSLKPRKTVIVPDGGAGFVFNVNPNDKWENSIVWGVMDSPTVVYNQQSVSRGKIRTFGVDFRPAGLYRFFNIPMSKFKNNSFDFEDISTRLYGEISEKVYYAKSVGELIRFMETFLLKLLDRNNTIHYVVSGALNSIEMNSGKIKIQELSREFNVSERSLNRLFNECVGMSPKLLCRIIRLQKVIKMCKYGTHKDFLVAAYESDYFDQAHFIKDFKEFCGCTPGEYLKRK